MRFHVVTLFPEMFHSLLQTALLGKAVQEGRVAVSFTDPRDFTRDRHRTTDDTPYGGGGGMVMKPEPVVAALEAVDPGRQMHRVLLTPQGRPLTQRSVARLHQAGEVALVCGRYEGFDERIRAFVDEEISLGDFVLNGGEVAAMALIDAVSRLEPGVLGNAQSVETESHSEGLLEYPQYTRPREFRGQEVPEVLLSGDHQAVARWRRGQMLARTRARRPDLWRRFAPRAGDEPLLAQAGVGHELHRRSYVALVHHPVHDRQGRVVTTAITNLDLHDIARSSRTYGLAGYFVVTPLTSQQELAQRIAGHWQVGHGARHNPLRREALDLLRVVADLEQAVAEIEAREGQPPLVVATTAREQPGQVGFDQLLAEVGPQQPLLLVLGTGWGLVADVLQRADRVLRPIQASGRYNHLSVRSAAAILLDRLFGLRD